MRIVHCVNEYVCDRGQKANKAVNSLPKYQFSSVSPEICVCLANIAVSPGLDS